MTEHKFTDTFRHKGLRNKLVEIVRQKGIADMNVLKAMEEVPRHWFFDSGFLEFAYEDKAFPIGAGQTISQPFTVAFQTQLLQVKRGDKILEVGTGSGYQASILYQMGAKIYSVERQRTLYTKTKVMLPAAGFRVKVFYGDGYKGLPAFAPFDKIIVTAGAPFIPENLTEQLKPGGIMVIPVNDGEEQVMITLTKHLDGSIKTDQHGRFRFVPLLGDKAHE